MRPGRRTRELQVGVVALVFVFVATTVADAQAEAGVGEPAAESARASDPASDPDPDPDPDLRIRHISREGLEPPRRPGRQPEVGDPSCLASSAPWRLDSPESRCDQASDPDPASSPVSDPASAPASSSPTRDALLQAAVTAAERDQPSLLLPWLATGLSVTTLLAGTVVGVINVTTCDGSCSTGPVWPWLIIVGCTFTSASTAWLVIATHDQSEARHRLERARRELERERIDRAPRAAASHTFTLRASF